MIKGLMMRRSVLDLIQINKEELFRGVKTEGSLHCSDCEMVEFMVLRGWSNAKSGSQRWTAGQQTWACSETCLEESYRRWTWRE